MKHADTIKTMIAGTGGFGIMLTDIDLGLKVLIGAATLVYMGIKIAKELREWK